MKKNTLYIVLIMLLACVNTAWGQVSDEAFEITKANGTVSYTSSTTGFLLQSNGTTVKLLKDFTSTSRPNCGSSMYTNCSVTLDLNGHTLNVNTGGTSNNYCILVTKGCTLTVKNGTIEMDPTSTAKENGFIVQEGATLNIESDVTINARNGISAVTIFGNSTLNTAGTLNAENSFAIAGNGKSGNGGYTINVTGGAVNATNAAAIYHPNTGIVNISGGTITGATGVYQKCGELNITGGTINGTGAKAEYTYNGNGANSTGDGVVIDNCGYPGGEPEVNITGGTFNSTNAKAVASYSYGDNEPITDFVSGGTFSPELENEYLAAAMIDDATYPTLQAAINAVQNGETITLVKNIETAESIDIEKGGFTLKGDGHSIICNDASITDATTEYLDSKGALNFKDITSETTVNIEDLSVQGFAYVINAEADVENLTVNMTNNDDTSISAGRALVNNWGTNNKFFLEKVKFHGLNNEEGGANQEFAVIVDNEGANSGVYSLSNCTITASVNTENKSATEDFITLKGPEAKALVLDGTTFTPDDADDDRMTFLRNPEQLINEGTNQLYLSDDVKEAYEAQFITPNEHLEILGTKETVLGLQVWPVVYMTPVVRVTDGANENIEYYSTLDDALASSLIAADASVELLADATLSSNVDLSSKLGEGETLSLYLTEDDGNGGTVTHMLTFGDNTITLGKMAAVNVVGGSTGVLDGLFVASDDETVIVGTILDTDKTYTAAQTKWTNTTIEIEMAEMFENVFTSTELANGDVIDLKTDVTLTQNLASNLADGKSFTLNFGDNTVTKSDYSVSLNTNTTAYTDKRTDIFTAAATGYVINEQKTATGYAYTPMNLDDAVAKIGDIYYATLANAIDFVQAGETIDVLKDIETATPTEVNKSGFTINGNVNGNDHSIICNDPTVTDPEAVYLNGKGALYFTAPGAVSIKNLSMKGFAYAVDVETDDAAITMTGGKVYGRAALNVHGNNNNFIFSGVEVHGLNNETNEGAEQFAAFVLDTDANDNTLTIENCPVTAFVKESGYNTEKFIELRGANNKVLVKGTTAYTCDPEEGAGFTNKSTDVANDKVYFDPEAKQQFQALFDKDTELEISDIETADKYSDLDVEGTYPLIASVPVVIVDDEYMFSTIEKAFASDKFDATMSTIKLLGDVTLAEDFAPTMESGEGFTININGKKLNGGGKHIVLKPGTSVNITGGATEEMAAMFAAADEETTTILAYKNDEGDYFFVAANVLFDEFPTLYTDAVAMLSNGNVVELKKDITMTEDIDLAAAGFTTGDKFTLKFAGKTLSGGKNIIIPDGVSVTTDRQTNIFTAANDASFILETANADGTFTYSVSASAPADGIVRNERTRYLYSTLQAATAAAEENDVLTVLASEIKTDKQVDITKSLTIQGGDGSNLVQVTNLGDNPHYIDMLPLFNLTGLAEGSEVTIKDINMDGFAYGVNVEHNVQGVTVNVKSTATTGSPVQFRGRAIINNWGSNNTFNVDNAKVDIFNDEISTGETDYQKFAAFVDNKSAEEDDEQYEAKNNTYNISNVDVNPTIGAGITADMANSVKFIDLRGSGAKVRLVNTKYYASYSSDLDYSAYGFTNDDYVNLLGEDNNSVWFDAASKENLNKHVSLVPGLRIDDTEVAPGFWPLVRVGGGVRLIPDPDNAPNVAYHYDTLKEAIESDKFKIGHSTDPATGDVSDIYPQISLLSDQVIDEDINLPAEFAPMSEYRFNILLAEDIGDETVKHTVTTAEGKGIILPALVYANVNDGADGSVDGIFKAADGQLVICSQVDGAEKAYTAANVKYLAGGDVDMAMFYVFDKLISDNILAADDKVVLMTNVALGGDITAPVAASEDFDIVFGEYDITGGSLKLVDGAAVNTDRQTTIFAPVDESHFIKESKNDDGTFRYEVLAAEPVDAVARIDNRYFTTLQAAANVAKDGETIVVLKNIETAETVDIKTAVTINGQGFQVKNTKQAHNAVAFNITAKGDVTFNKLNIYNPNGDAIEVNDGYNGQLTINNSKINSSRRAIDVQSVAEGFGLTVNGSEMSVIFKQKDDEGRDNYLVDDTKDPKKEYVNMISAGVYFANDPVAANVLIDKTLIQGFSYGVNVSNNSGKLNVTLSDGTFYGRAVVNNWGDGSTFNLDNMAVNGLNNEPAPVTTGQNDYEYFATIVDNVAAEGTDQTGKAEHNTYNINNSTFTANADNATAPAATEKFIDLRGDNAQVKITGNTTYTYAGDAANAESKGGFTNPEFFLNLYNNNKVWFDEAAKAVFRPLVETFVDGDGNNVTIVDELDPVVNLYPLGQFEAAVVMHVFDDAGNETKYYFADLDKALTSPQFGADVQIDLLKNQDLSYTDENGETVSKEYTIDVPFTLNLNVQTGGMNTPDDDSDDVFTPVTVKGVKFNLVPANSVTVIGGSTATDALFQVAEGYEDYAAIIKDGVVDPTYFAANVFNDGIYTYTYFDYLFDETRDETLMDEGYVRVETDFQLDQSLKVPSGVKKFYIDYNNGKKIDRDDYSIVLKPGQEVYTNADAEDLFSSADPEYTVMVDAVSVTKELINDKGTPETDDDVVVGTYSFTKKYYLMKDGLAVTVAPATYCGHEQTPTVIVKKRVEKEAPAEDEWITLTAGTDYEVKLVPSQAEDAYIAAKTYANSIIIEGKTFQGRRKADFIINPREISDVTVTGNEQPSRDNGYTRELIANAIAAEYGCIITEHKKDATTVMTYTLKKKGATTEKPDYVVTVDLAEGQRIYEIGTYKDLITVAALEGTEGTQNFVGSRKLDFVILPGDAINIANVLITSKAVYNSLTQIPSYESIEVTYKNGYNKVVLDPNQFKIEIHGMQHDYVDAKTYTNAITLKGTGKVGTTNSLKFYGTINADYVIMPRDLADTDFEDDKVQVVLEKNKDMDWTGEDLTNEIKIGDIVGANNIYFYMKVQTGDTYNGYRYVLTNDATTGKYDYSYTVEPSPMKDPGEYKVIFTGRGNFTGMTELKINVLKDINAADAEIALQVIPGVNETNYTSGSGLTANDLKDVNITDGDATLSNGTHYTIALNTDPIKEEGKYTATITGKAPYYKGEKTVDFPAVYEYYTYAAANVSGNKFGIHVTSGKDKTANVGAMDHKAVNPSTQGLIINPTKNVTLTGVDEPVALTIAGIDDNAFNGGNALRYVDASQLDDYEPSSLSRNADGPFNGISKQAIVYLDGDDVIGENYVYETSAGDFRCDEFKIYDDFDGNQKGFDGEGQGSHSWEIINIHEFTAKTLTNTRYFNAGQHYTTLLPYDLPLPETLKAYNLTAASDGIFGFREIEEDALTSFMPYVLIPSAAGNLLSTTDAVVKVTATANRGFYPLRDNLHRQTTEIAKSGYVLYGSMIYMGHTSTTPIIEGTYIMQSGNQWKKIAPNSTYDGACILPMRAYILKLNDGIDGHSREFMSAKFIDGVKEMTTDMAGDDWNDAEVYDLQGRKVDTTQQMRKGVYIVNGQKRIRK